MAETMPQTFENHAKTVPLYHFVALPILLINLLWALYRAATGFSFDAALGAAVALALVVVAFYARVFALGAQDRTIRLEERLRMDQLLPDDLKPRVNDLTIDQVIALRFASDAELPDLARRVLDEGIGERKVVKQTIKTWRPDHQRL